MPLPDIFKDAAEERRQGDNAPEDDRDIFPKIEVVLGHPLQRTAVNERFRSRERTAVETLEIASLFRQCFGALL